MDFPQRAILIKVSDGLGYHKNDEKYIGKAFNRVLNIVDTIKGNMFLTDFYIPEFKEENNDYVRYGFLIVSRKNIEFVIS